MKFRRLLAIIMSALMVASCVSFASAQDELPAEEIAEEAVMVVEEVEEEVEEEIEESEAEILDETFTVTLNKLNGDCTVTWGDDPSTADNNKVVYVQSNRSIEKVTVNAGESFTIPAVTRTRAVLLGWAASEGGEVVYQPGASFTPEADTALYAVWERGELTNQPIYNFTANNASNGNPQSGKAEKFYDAVNDVVFFRYTNSTGETAITSFNGAYDFHSPIGIPDKETGARGNIYMVAAVRVSDVSGKNNGYNIYQTWTAGGVLKGFSNHPSGAPVAEADKWVKTIASATVPEGFEGGRQVVFYPLGNSHKLTYNDPTSYFDIAVISALESEAAASAYDPLTVSPLKDFKVSFDLNYEGAPTLDGYPEEIPERDVEFKGWSTNKDAAVGEDIDLTCMPVPTANVTYYAIWDSGNTTEITFNRRNGAKDAAITTALVNLGTPVPFPEDPTYLNHTFLGWSTEIGNAEKIVDPATTVVTEDMLAGGMTYYAVYESNIDKSKPIFFVTAQHNLNKFHNQGNSMTKGQLYDAENDVVYAHFFPNATGDNAGTAGSCNMYGLDTLSFTADVDKLYLTYYVRTNITGKGAYVGMYNTTNKNGATKSFTGTSTTTISADSADKWQKIVFEIPNMAELGICTHVDFSAVGNSHKGLSAETNYFDIGAIAIFEDKAAAEAFDIAAASKADTIEISFNTDGGSTYEPVEYITGTYKDGKVVFPETNPTKTNYTFKGWSASLHGALLDTANTAVPAADTTYYAVWEMSNPATASDSVYISNSGCDSCNNGLSATYPVKTLAKANTIISANAGIDKIVVVGTFTTANDNDIIGVAGRTITVTGADANAVFDYDANKSGTDDDIILAGPIIFKNIIINEGSGDGVTQTRGNKIVYDEGVKAKSAAIEVSAYSNSPNEIHIKSGSFGRVLPGPVSASYAGTTNITVDGGTISSIVLGHGWRGQAKIEGTINVTVNGGNVSLISLNSNGDMAAVAYRGLRYYTLNGGTVGNIQTTEGSQYYNSQKVSFREGTTVFEINKAGILTGTASLGCNVVTGKEEADNSTRILLFNNGSYVDGKVKDTGAITVNTTGGVIKAVVDVDSSYNATLKGYSFTPALESYDRAEINGEVYELSEFEGGNIPANMFEAGINTVEFFEEIEEGKTVTFVSDGETVQSGLVAVGTVPTAPALTKTGYTLTWDKEIVAVTEEVTYTAVWTANEYDVTFNAGEGTFADGKTVTVKTVFNSAITAPANPTRDGYVFFGWDKTVGNLTTEGVTFNAVWEANHVAAYRAQGYKILYVASKAAGTGDGSTSANAKAHSNEVATAIKAGEKGVVVLVDKITVVNFNTNAGATVVVTENDDNGIFYFEGSVSFGSARTSSTAPANIIFDNVHISHKNDSATGERILNINGNNLTFTETVTNDSSSFPGEGPLNIHAGQDGSAAISNSTGEINITLNGGSRLSVRAGGWGGSRVEADINYVIGGTAHVSALNCGGHSLNPALTIQGKTQKGDVSVVVKDNARIGTIQASNAGILNGNISIDIQGGTVTKIAPSTGGGGALNGNIAINVTGGTLGSVDAKGATVNGIVTADIDLDNAALTGTVNASVAYAIAHRGDGTYVVNTDAAGVKTLALTPGATAKYVRVTNGTTVKEYNVAGDEVTLMADLTALALGTGLTTVEFLADGTEGKTVTFVSDGETVQSGLVAVGTVPTAPALTKTGYTLTWDKEIVAVTEEVTYTAVWTANKHNVIYMLDGEEYRKTEVAYGTTVEILTAPTKTGYTFSGWNVTEAFTMPDEDVTITGTFTVNKHNVIYMLDGAEHSKTEYAYGANVEILAAPTKTGYTFSGWNKTEAFTMPDEDVTITGTFTVNKHNVIYMLDGAEYNKTEYAYGATVEILAAPTKTGYTFSGWSKTEAFTMPDEDVTITGTFTKDEIDEPVIEGATYKTYGSYDASEDTYTVVLKLAGTKAHVGSFGFAFPASCMTLKEVLGGEGTALLPSVASEDAQPSPIFVNDTVTGYYANTWTAEGTEDGYIDATESEISVAVLVFDMNEAGRDALDTYFETNEKFAEYVIDDADEKYHNGTNYLVATVTNDLSTPKAPVVYASHTEEVTIETKLVVSVNLIDDRGDKLVSPVRLSVDGGEALAIETAGAVVTYTIGSLEAGKEYTIRVEKNGYAYGECKVTLEEGENTLEFTLVPGDIKGSATAYCGDGIVDIDDFVRLIRAFDTTMSEEFKSFMDINEDGYINVTDLNSIKTSFGKTTADTVIVFNDEAI